MEMYQITPEINNVQKPTNYTSSSSRVLDIFSDINEFLFIVGLNNDGGIFIDILSITFNKFDAPGKSNKTYVRIFGKIY